MLSISIRQYIYKHKTIVSNQNGLKKSNEVDF
jgi:hypothetical protein